MCIRKIIFSFAVSLVSISAFGQNFPDCDDLTVESIHIDTTGDLALTIRNTCYSCTYGAEGCVYNEILVLRTVFPFDTIAASGCYCLYWDDPNTSGELQTFTLGTNVTSIPPIPAIQVKINSCSCHSVPFSQSLSGKDQTGIKSSFSVFPNPAHDVVHVGDIPAGAILHITDIAGKLMYSSVFTGGQTSISTLNFADGMYIVKVVYKGVVSDRKLVVNKQAK